MNRRNSGGLPSILFFIFFIFVLTGGPFGLMALLPLVLPFLIIFAVVKSASRNSERDNMRSSVRVNRNPYSNTNEKVNKAFISGRDKTTIDRKLKEYYSKHYRLPIFEDIALVTKNGQYNTFEDLYVAKGEELILSLDEFGNMFPGTHAEIISLLKAFSKQEEKVMAAEVKMPEIKKEEVLSDAEKYIEKINSLNVAIPQVEITNGLYQTCALLKQIDLASKKSKNDSKIEKLYDYYLPILLKILENYKDLMVSGARGDEFKKVETQLIKTIILINEALKTINNTMHEDDYMNLSADITTLQSLLKKDGLVKEGTIFEGEDKHE